MAGGNRAIPIVRAGVGSNVIAAEVPQRKLRGRWQMEYPRVRCEGAVLEKCAGSHINRAPAEEDDLIVIAPRSDRLAKEEIDSGDEKGVVVGWRSAWRQSLQ